MIPPRLRRSRTANRNPNDKNCEINRPNQVLFNRVPIESIDQVTSKNLEQ